MTDKPKRGRPPKAENKRRRNTINVRLDDAAHSEVKQAALKAGRSLSGEIQRRLADYERMFKAVPECDMTLRDWFAGQALAGIMANPNVVSIADAEVVKAAYQHADAMLDARAG